MTQQETRTEGVDAAWVADFAQEWLAAWNSHEPDRLLALMTDDIVYDDTAWPTTMHGHGDVRAFLDHAWRGMPDLRFEVRSGPYVHPDEPRASFWWNGSGTHTGPLDPPGLPPTGKRLAFDGADFHEYRDGKVARLRIVFDMGAVIRQLGLLPEAGSREEKLMARAAGLRQRFARR
jgi:steroid delta-isomerase-like uncharacterized protein